MSDYPEEFIGREIQMMEKASKARATAMMREMMDLQKARDQDRDFELDALTDMLDELSGRTGFEKKAHEEYGVDPNKAIELDRDYVAQVLAASLGESAR